MLVAQRIPSDRVRVRRVRLMLVGVLTVLVGCALVVLYALQSRTCVVGADGATLELQAWDMLHGNVLLHDWWMSDVSFWPTELGEYALLLSVHGLSQETIHLGGALTYTVVLLLAALTARAGLTGRGPVRAIAFALTAAIMISPSLGTGTRILLEEPEHFGSAAPVLLAWLFIAGLRPRWYVPVLVALVLTVGVVSDPLILASGTVAVTAGVLACWWATRRSSPAPRWYWPALACGGVTSWPLATAASALIRADGGFSTAQVRTQYAGWAQIVHHLRLAGQGIASLFGAGFGQGIEGGSGPFWFAVLHLAGLALAAMALVVVLVRPSRWTDPVLPGLAVAIVLLAAMYVGSGYAVDPLSVREISAVLPFGAVLAGRVLADPALAAWGRLRGTSARVIAGGLAATVLAGYLAALGFGAAQPAAVPPAEQAIGNWLAAHGFRSGLALTYWVANTVTVDSGGQVTVREIDIYHERVVVPSGWGHKGSWYSPSAAYAGYVLSAYPPRSGAWHGVVASFGKPVRVERADGYWVLIYDRNLLKSL